MHNDPLDRSPQSGDVAEPLHCDTSNAFDQRLIRALEAAPRPQISSDFTARLTARLPPSPAVQPSFPLPETHYGRSMTLIGIVVSLSAILGLAAHMSKPSSFQLAIEWILLAEFVALTLWLSAYRSSAD